MAKFITHCVLALFTIFSFFLAYHVPNAKGQIGVGIFFGLVWFAFTYFTSETVRYTIKDKFDERRSKAAAEHDQQVHEATKQPYQEQRQKQLAALREAIPKSLPERMRATIRINEVMEPRFKNVRIGRMFGEDTWVSQPDGETRKFAVDMILEMTETERAVIKENDLDLIVLEETAAYTEVEILKRKAQAYEEVKALKDPLKKQIAAEVGKEHLDYLKSEKNVARIGDLLVSPFTRIFNTQHEAHEYVDKIKTKFLPRVRELIEKCRTSSGQTETFEF